MDGKNGAITTLGILYPIYAFITDPDLLSFLATVFSGVVIAGFVKAMGDRLQGIRSQEGERRGCE